jgi:hypothetical protein
VSHPCNGGKVSGTVDAFEAAAKRQTVTMHAFYLRVNGGGGSSIVGPRKRHNLLAVSAECRRNNPAFPMVGPPSECLLHAEVRIHDAFGYWPVRSFRASEAAAAAYLQLYRRLGGKNPPQRPQPGARRRTAERRRPAIESGRLADGNVALQAKENPDYTFAAVQTLRPRV